MDMEHKCDAHGESATAYCRVHKVLLCTKCFINNVHKVENCELCETQTLSPTDILYLDLKSLENTIKERTDMQKAEQKSLEDLQKVLGGQVEACYGSLLASLGEMKQKTLDYLYKSIDRRNVAVVRRSDVLLQSQAKLLEYMNGVSCNTQAESQDPINIGKIEQELKSLMKKIDKSFPSFFKPIEGTFIPYETMLTFPDKVLGDIEFSDELYDHVGEEYPGQSQATKGHQNEASDKANKANEKGSIQVNDREVDGSPPKPALPDTAPEMPKRMPKPPDVDTNKPPVIPPRKPSTVGKDNSINNGSEIYATVVKTQPSSETPQTEAGTMGKFIVITDGSDAYETVAKNQHSDSLQTGDVTRL